MTLEPNSKVLVSQTQAHGNCSIITAGELIAVQGETATVLLEGEAIARDIPVSAVKPSDELLGGLSNRPNEQSVINMIPNTRRY